jgi:hypothetical protein
MIGTCDRPFVLAAGLAALAAAVKETYRGNTTAGERAKQPREFHSAMGARVPRLHGVFKALPPSCLNYRPHQRSENLTAVCCRSGREQDDSFGDQLADSAFVGLANKSGKGV